MLLLCSSSIALVATYLISSLPSTSAAPITHTEQFQPRPNLTAVVVFGDSLSDNGSGVYALTNGSWPLSKYGYDQGRFSNGRVWPEYLAANLSVPLHNYAYGGATTSNTIVQGLSGNGSTVPVPSVDEQVTSFLAHIPAGLDINSTLFAVTGGVNDLFFNQKANPLVAVSVIAQQVAKLQRAGAQHFLLFNYYDISRIPYDSYIQPADKEINYAYSIGLQQGLSELHQATNGSYFFSLSRDLLPRLYYYGEPTSYGFDKYAAYGSCLTGVYRETASISRCDDPDAHVFWDEYHPTTHTHSLIAHGIVAKLNGQKTSY